MASDPSIHVRAPRRVDGDALARIWEDTRRRYAEEDPQTFVSPDRRHPVEASDVLRPLMRADADAERLARVAELDGAVVGYVLARLEEPIPDAATAEFLRDRARVRCHVELLLVHPSFWRRGVGTELMVAVETWAEEHRAEIIRLGTSVRSPGAVAFYESLGYEASMVILRKPLTEDA